MLILRSAQIAAFSAAGTERFVNKMVKHHWKYFPEWSRHLGADGLDAFIRHGMERANLHGFETELEIARYLHVVKDQFGKTYTYKAVAKDKSLASPPGTPATADSDGSDALTGAIIGGLAGAAAGAAIGLMVSHGNKKAAVLGAVVGAVAGALIGAGIGSMI